MYLKIKVPLIILLSLLLTACKKKDVATDELSKLPPATQSGARTFGCLVNGQAFLPKGNLGPGGSGLQCNFIFENGTYNLAITANDYSDPTKSSTLALDLDNTVPKAGVTYILRSSGNAVGRFTRSELPIFDNHYSTGTSKDILTITNFDQDKQIVSGTFSFDAASYKGEKVEVRNGRFDLPFTR